jgi:hypothetical protein
MSPSVHPVIWSIVWNPAWPPQKAHDPLRFWTRVIQRQQGNGLEGFAPYLCLFHKRIPHLIEMSQMFSRLSIVRPWGQQQNWDPIPSNLDTDLGEDLSTMIVLLNEIRVVSSNWPPTPVNVSGCYFEELSERNFLTIKCQNQGCGLTSHGATNSHSPSNFMWGRGHKETAGGKLSLKAAWLFSHTSSNIL